MKRTKNKNDPQHNTPAKPGTIRDRYRTLARTGSLGELEIALAVEEARLATMTKPLAAEEKLQAALGGRRAKVEKIGRASCRERV